MKRLAFFFGLVVVLIVGGGTNANTQTLPPCRMGTDWAVNPNRQLAPGEHFEKVSGGSVKMDERESPKSLHIVSKMCNMPETEAAVGGPGGPWAKICGNNFTPMGWALPSATPIVNLSGLTFKAPQESPAVVPTPIPTPVSTVAPTVTLIVTQMQTLTPVQVVKPTETPVVIVTPTEKHSHKKLVWTLVGVAAGGFAAYEAWYWWPCPPGTVWVK